MPELPEVETTVNQLKKKVLGRAFIDAWTDSPKIIRLRQGFGKQVKKPPFEQFKREIKGKKIQKVWRRGKNIIFDLSEQKALLIHQKLTGHLLVGNWKLEIGNWKPLKTGPLWERINTYIHLMFRLDKNLMLALSDLRKFAKVELWNKDELEDSKEFRSLGPEPLEENFTFEKFKEILKNKKGKIKQVLMDQEIIAGIGNIYSDEILWEAKIHPFKEIKRLSDEEIKRIYGAMQKILKKAVKLGGESISDYRDIEGKKGGFDILRKVYRREGEKCPRCGVIIKRIKIGGRSAHFCSKCQKI